MRAAFCLAMVVMVALAAGVQAQINEDLSLLQLKSSLPSSPTHSVAEQQVIDQLHTAAGDWADDAIAEAMRELPSQNGALLEAASHSGIQSKWDDSVPEIHLHMDAPEDKLLRGIEIVDSLQSSPSEISQIMQSFQTPQMFVESQAKAKAAEAVAAQTSAVVSTEVALDSDAASDAEILTDAEADAGVVTMSELKNMMELQGMTQEQIDQYMEHLGNTEVDAEAVVEAEAETETEVDAEAQTDAIASVEAEGEAEMDAENEATNEAEAEATEEVGMVETEAESESEAEADSDAESEEAVPVHDHANPENVEESTESTVTPLHSAEYERRMHPAIRAVRNSGYGAPSFLQAASRTHAVARQANPAFNPQSVQLGPSRDAYGYAPMTGAEFLTSPQHASLAQVSVQYQPAPAQWLPPPIESEAVPNYVVGVGGLRPNVNNGPYAGQYGIAAGGIEMHQEPQFPQ